MARLAAVAAAAALAAAGAAAAGAAPAAPLAPAPEVAVWSGSSSIVFGAAGRHGGIYLVRRDGSGLRRLTTAGGGDGGLAISPDGRTVLFASGGAIFRIGIDGTGLRRVTAGFSPSWSPDGRRIAFARNDGVYLARADGSGARKLVTDRYPESAAPTWSPAGDRVAYVACTAPFLSRPCEHQYGFDLYTIRKTGSGKHRVTPRSGFPQCPSWSRAGRLAFLTEDATVAIVQPSGRLRTFRPGGCPVWARGGGRLAVATATGASLLGAGGGGRRRIAILPGSHTLFRSVAWSADGTTLALVGGATRAHLYVAAANG